MKESINIKCKNVFICLGGVVVIAFGGWRDKRTTTMLKH